MRDPMRPAAMQKHVSQGPELSRGQEHRSLLAVNTGPVFERKGPNGNRVQSEVERVKSRGEASRCVVEAYALLMSRN
jgi:hypothetical protein